MERRKRRKNKKRGSAKADRRVRVALAAGAVLATSPAEAAVFTASNASDSGAGSFR